MNRPTTYAPCSTNANMYVPPTVHINQPTTNATMLAWGPQSQSLTCPHCQAHISTRVDLKANSNTHLMAALICFFGGGICCCCLIPYCKDSCLAKQHYCPACQNFLGEHKN